MAVNITLRMFSPGDLATYRGPAKACRYFGRIGTVLLDDGENLQIQFSKTETPTFKKYMAVFEVPSEEEVKIANFKADLLEFEYGDVYLRWLRAGGDDGAINDCTCPKDEHYNKTCTCRALVKLNHRFSTIKDKLVNEYGYKIDDVRMENGKHKTILRYEPPTFKKVIE